MKKIILNNDEEYYQVKCTISKKKHFFYLYNKITKYRSLEFLKNKSYHKHCNKGPAAKSKLFISYIENGKYHNLYGHAYINNLDNIKEYYVYNQLYEEATFKQYINILNNLSYKRTY